jgi:hypothetical protein
VIINWSAALLDAWLAVSRTAKGWRASHPRNRDLWRGIPGDIMGLMVMRGCGIAAPTRQVESGEVTALLVEDPRVERWFRIHLMPVRAQTVGNYIFARETVSPSILAHECEHIRQWDRFGPLFPVAYLGSSALAFVRGRRPYWDNYFEAAARARSQRETGETRDPAAADPSPPR